MNLKNVLAKRLSGPVHKLSERDCILFALGIGMGGDGEGAADLPYLYEKDLKCFPAMMNVLSHPGPWIMDPECDFDWVRMLHSDQGFVVHKPLQPGRSYQADYRFTDVIDKGKEKGALLHMEKQLRDAETDELVGTVHSTLFMRGDGGCGSTRTDSPAPVTMPDRAPDHTHTLPISSRAAMIYRLSGDYNPLHIDPKVAAKAGFDKPILHGLCSMAMAARAVIATCCDDDPQRLGALKVRFSSPVYPGETLATDLWREADRVVFQTRSVERGIIVMSQGVAGITG